MLVEIKPNEQAQERIEEIATALQSHLRDKEGEIYPLPDLIVAVEGWLENSLLDLLSDGEEHLFKGSASYAVGRQHLKDELAAIESHPIAVAVPSPAMPIAV